MRQITQPTSCPNRFEVANLGVRHNRGPAMGRVLRRLKIRARARSYPKQFHGRRFVSMGSHRLRPANCAAGLGVLRRRLLVVCGRRGPVGPPVCAPGLLLGALANPGAGCAPGDSRRRTSAGNETAHHGWSVARWRGCLDSPDARGVVASSGGYTADITRTPRFGEAGLPVGCPPSREVISCTPGDKPQPSVKTPGCVKSESKRPTHRHETACWQQEIRLCATLNLSVRQAC